MAPLHALSNRSERRERLIPTQIWDANYVHAMHYYQPMIDYLDAKRRGRTPERIPYLPYTEERGLNRFHTSHFAFRPYSAEEIALLSTEAVDKAESYLPDYRSDIKRSVLSLTATADAARLRKHVTPDSVLDRYQRKLSQRYAQQNQQESRDRMALCRRTQYYSEMKGDDLSPEVKKAIRGKSANQISNILLNESRNKSRASEERSMSKVVRSSSSARISGGNRATSEVRTYVIKSSSGAETCSEESSQQYKAMHTSVDNVRREIKNFAVKTTEFLHDTR
uniref:Paramyosin, short form n=1 Tax=Culex pipiens TaxID=7175 RepID=A0A8D8F4G9_CULPI